MILHTDPKITRRKEVPGRPILMADGLEWYLAVPSRLLRPKLTASIDEFGRKAELLTIEVRIGYPLLIHRLIERLQCACATGTLTAQYEAFLELAIKLLIRAHAIDSTIACQLLTVPEDDFPRLLQDVLNLISFDPLGHSKGHTE